MNAALTATAAIVGLVAWIGLALGWVIFWEKVSRHAWWGLVMSLLPVFSAIWLIVYLRMLEVKP